MSGPIVPGMTVLEFDPEFEYRQVFVTGIPTIPASGTVRLNGVPVCVVGDERDVVVEAVYELPSYSPGQGIVTILELMPEQISSVTRNDRPLILGQGEFIAQFEPITPAIQTETGVPDAAVPTLGSGRFVMTQLAARAG